MISAGEQEDSTAAVFYDEHVNKPTHRETREAVYPDQWKFIQSLTPTVCRFLPDTLL